MLACTPVEEPPENFVGIGEPSRLDSSVEDSPADSEEPVDSEDPPDSDPPPEPLELCINEFMPDNQSVLIAEDGSTPDWIELHNPSEEHLLLNGWSMADAMDEDVRHVFGDVVLPAAGYLLLYADGQPDLGEDHLDFKLSSEGGDVAIWAPDGRGQVVHYGHVEPDWSVARLSDCCLEEGCWDFDFRGSPGATNDSLVESVAVEKGSSWRWYDGGEPPTDWSGRDFDDWDWSVGDGDFGFGEPARNTEVASGPDGDRTPTIYFRHELSLDAVEGAEVSLNIDDGAILWVNGVEAVRQNLPEGDVGHLTWASTAIGDAAESAFTTHDLDAGLFVVGDNVLAVEVHQATATSSDLGFDLELTVLQWAAD